MRFKIPDYKNPRDQTRIEAAVRFLQLSVCFLPVFWLSACATMDFANAPDELALTLEDAIVAIPAQYFKWDVPSGMFTKGRMKDVAQDLTKIAGENKIPLVIYLHGCSGFGYSTSIDIQFLLSNGYAVLAPNSFARKYKPKSCESSTYTGGLHRDVLFFRLAEAKYVHEKAKTLPWVDKRNIFMMGFSEGGITTAQYRLGGLAGKIILGWTCNSGWPEYSGISGPRDEPILAVVASNDPWFRNPWTSGHCGSSMFFRRNAESVVVNVNFHHVQSLPEVKEKILKFLELNRRP
jgi:dienelactone hydrolase